MAEFEIKQEMYLLLRRIEERIIVMDACEEQNKDEWLLFKDVDEIYNIGEYAEIILSYVRASGDKDMMLECCKVDRDVLHRLMALIEDKRAIASLLKCVGCLFKIHNMALEKMWGIDVEDIENGKYCIDIYGKCYRMDGKEAIFIPKP